MKILMVSTPATGHINPLLAVGHVLMAEGHELVVLSGSWLRDRIERAGAQFRALPGNADADFRNVASFAPELTEVPPGYEWLRIAVERFFIDLLPAQNMGLRQVLKDFPADVILGDDMFFGVLPMLLGPRSERPAIALCGTSILHWCREDGAPHFLGLPPATSPAELERYAAIAEEYERLTNGPVGLRSRAWIGYCTNSVSVRYRCRCSNPWSGSLTPTCNSRCRASSFHAGSPQP